MDSREWWVSWPTKKGQYITCWIKTAGGAGSKIIDAAPIARKWINQNFFRMVSYYGAKYEPLGDYNGKASKASDSERNSL